MKTKHSLAQYVLLLFLISTLNSQLSTRAQGTAFTYQGRLNDGALPAHGVYDLRFAVYDSSSGGGLAGGPVTNLATSVSNGLFTATLDFGGGALNVLPRWLEIAVRTNGAGSFVGLTPRLPVTPTPYAVFAENVGSGGLAAGTYGNAVTLNNAANIFSGNGAGITSVNAATLGGLTSSSLWKLGGNAGANPATGNFLGTTDNLPLELRVNGRRALRIEPISDNAGLSNTINVINGSPVNFVSSLALGGTISGGGAWYAGSLGATTNSVTGDFGTVGGGLDNTAGGFSGTVAGGYHNTTGDANGHGDFTTISGGEGNSASGPNATVSGGYYNNAGGSYANIGGGDGNLCGGAWATIGGGFSNTANFLYCTVGGGDGNTAIGNAATVPGGASCTAAGDYSLAAGNHAKANHPGSFVWADSQAGNFASTANDQFLIRAQGGIGIGNNNPQAPLHVTGGGDAGLGSGGNIISGLTSGQNLVIDNNEIISRNNGAVSDLVLNLPGGSVGVGRNPTANKLEVAGEASKAAAGNWLANSDARIKTGVQTVTNALDKLAQVRLVRFRYTDDYRAAHPGIADREYLNVIAQEFQKVFPEDVKRSGEKLANGDDILQVDTYPLTIYSAAAVQELNRKLTDELKRRDAENTELKQRLETLEKMFATRNSN